VDPLVLIMTVLIGGLLVWVIFLGLYHPAPAVIRS
jgi:hypothetical protein